MFRFQGRWNGKIVHIHPFEFVNIRSWIVCTSLLSHLVVVYIFYFLLKPKWDIKFVNLNRYLEIWNILKARCNRADKMMMFNIYLFQKFNASMRTWLTTKKVDCKTSKNAIVKRTKEFRIFELKRQLVHTNQ